MGSASYENTKAAVRLSHDQISVLRQLCAKRMNEIMSLEGQYQDLTGDTWAYPLTEHAQRITLNVRKKYRALWETLNDAAKEIEDKVE